MLNHSQPRRDKGGRGWDSIKTARAVTQPLPHKQLVESNNISLGLGGNWAKSESADSWCGLVSTAQPFECPPPPPGETLQLQFRLPR